MSLRSFHNLSGTVYWPGNLIFQWQSSTLMKRFRVGNVYRYAELLILSVVDRYTKSTSFWGECATKRIRCRFSFPSSVKSYLVYPLSYCIIWHWFYTLAIGLNMHFCRHGSYIQLHINFALSPLVDEEIPYVFDRMFKTFSHESSSWEFSQIWFYLYFRWAEKERRITNIASVSLLSNKLCFIQIYDSFLMRFFKYVKFFLVHTVLDSA